MGFSKVLKTTIISLGLLSLVACSSYHDDEDKDYLAFRSGSSNSDQVTLSAVDGDASFPGVTDEELESSSMAEQAAKAKDYTVLFGFDSSRVRPEYQAIVESNARYLKSHPNARIRLEGHTDPRGSREYNIGLGQRRSDSIEKQLEMLGVTRQQMASVSYGKERLAAPGNDEEAYRLDRRVELVYEDKG